MIYICSNTSHPVAPHRVNDSTNQRWGILCHSVVSACRSCNGFCGCLGRCATRRPNSSHTCSIGAMSGESAGQSITGTMLAGRNAVQSGDVRTRTIMLQSRDTRCPKVRQNYRSKHLIAVSKGIHRSIEKVEISPGVAADAGPHHHRSIGQPTYGLLVLRCASLS